MDINKTMTTGEGVENLDENLLTLDSEFRFKCRHCGKCCKNHTILFNAKDIFNIARTLGKTPKQFVEECAMIYIGKNSRIPVIRMVMRGPKNACPLLLDNGRCSVHECKPDVCALYPLGRVAIPLDSSKPLTRDNVQAGYVFSDVTCGSAKKVNTVRGWLAKFGISEVDPFYPLWIEVINTFSETVKKLEERNCSDGFMRFVLEKMGYVLFLDYDTSLAFMPQFEANAEMILKACECIGELDNYCHEGGSRPPFLGADGTINL